MVHVYEKRVGLGDAGKENGESLARKHIKCLIMLLHLTTEASTNSHQLK